MQTGSEKRLSHLSITQLYFLEGSLLNLSYDVNTSYGPIFCDKCILRTKKNKKLLICQVLEESKGYTPTIGQRKQTFCLCMYTFPLYFDFSNTEKNKQVVCPP